MKSFNVIWWDFNKSEPEPYDIIPYLVRCYNESNDKPSTLEEFKDFIKHESMYRWWSRCEYEMIISNWPTQDKSKKIDIYYQVMMNIEIIANLLMEEVNGNQAKELDK